MRKQVGKMKKTFDVETLAKENFSENSAKENPSSAEKDQEKEVKERAEEDLIRFYNQRRIGRQRKECNCN